MTNNNEIMDEEMIEEVKESKFKGFMNKAGAGIKKHGKKVAGVAALAAVGMIGYALGHKSGDNDSDYDITDYNSSPIDDVEVEQD